ncbi:hypothetical protein OEZ85_007057 [Tetradesmus obliquus]|uniref:Tbc2 translation factor, chloroplastic n=1 Tax=Tetradesmus obliquus TaxID=3088 RepID=A0ABY8TWF9_TETOB|nr:hypothetical protein OEZ85_007057 [Tetradesmus obliquus]
MLPCQAARGLHQLLWSMAKLQWMPEQHFLELFWAASAAQLPHMTPHATSGILWAAASLEVTPPAPWLQAWLATMQQQLLQRRCNDQDVSNALWALVKLGVRPDDAWLAAAMDGSGAVLDGAGSQELSLLLWSWAKLGVRPQQAWMQGWLQAMGQRMGSYCAPALASSAYALALLRFRPPRAWCEQLVGESQRQMAAFGAQELACLAWALAVLRLRPDRAWLEDFQSQALSESGSFNGQELSLICWALARLGHRPPVAWLAALLHDGLELQGGLAGQSLVLLVQALARWDLPQLKEGGKYRVLLPRYWAASQQLLPRCSLYQLSVLWWARARLGCMPGSAWGEAFWAAATPALAAALHAAPGGVYGATRAAAELNMHSPQLVVGAAEQHAQLAPSGVRAARDALSLSPAIVGRLIWATGKMSRHVPAATFGLMLQAAQRVVPQCSFEGLTAMGLGLARMRRVAAAAAAAAAAAGRHAAATSVQGQQQGAGCVASTCQQAELWGPWFARSLQLLQQDPKAAAQLRLHQQHSQDRGDVHSGGGTASTVHLQGAAEQQQQQRASIHSADISLQLYIAAHFQLAPPAAWSRAMLAATSVTLQGMSLEQLSWVVWAVARLRLGPQLPPGWLAAVLVRISHVPVRPSGAAAAAMSRLGKSMWRLSCAECVQPQERQLWLLTARRWSTAHGMV